MVHVYVHASYAYKIGVILGLIIYEAPVFLCNLAVPTPVHVFHSICIIANF